MLKDGRISVRITYLCTRQSKPGTVRLCARLASPYSQVMLPRSSMPTARKWPGFCLGFLATGRGIDPTKTSENPNKGVMSMLPDIRDDFFTKNILSMTCQWSEGKKEIVFTTVWEGPRTTGRMLSHLALEPEDRRRTREAYWLQRLRLRWRILIFIEVYLSSQYKITI